MFFALNAFFDEFRESNTVSLFLEVKKKDLRSFSFRLFGQKVSK